MIRRSTTTIAMLLVLAGAALVAGPVFGFTTLAADRGVSVQTADGGSALLGVDATGETPDNQNDVDIVEITNNANVDFDPLETRVTLDDPNGALAISDDFADNLTDGETTGLELTCASGGSGTATVDVSASATSSTLTVQGVDFTHTFDYSCTGSGSGGGGPANFEASDVQRPENTQTFSFDVAALKNKDVATIDLSDAQENSGVDYAGATVDVTSGHDANGLEYDDGTYEIRYEASGNVKGTFEIEISGFEITDEEGGSVTYSDTTGRDDSDSFDVPALADGG